jgi:hypothetical protein
MSEDPVRVEFIRGSANAGALAAISHRARSAGEVRDISETGLYA